MKVRRLVYFTLWVISLISISFTGGAMSYGFFFAMTAIPFLCLAYIAAVLLAFRFYQELEHRTVVSGTLSGYRFIIKNSSPFSFSGLQVNFYSGNYEIDDVKPDCEYELVPGGEFSYETKIVCKYRGEYDVGVASVDISDFLSLFRIRYKNLSTAKAIVTPRYITPNVLKALSDTDAPFSRSLLFGNDNPDSAVRDYAPGDSLKRIHWKASAASGKLKTRNYYDETRRGVSLFCEGKRYSSNPGEFLPLENKMLEILLSATSYFSSQNIITDITVGSSADFRNIPVATPEMFNSLYKKISDFHFSDSADEISDRLSYTENCILNPPHIAIFTVHGTDPAFLTALRRLTEAGTTCVLYIVDSKAGEEYKKSSGRKRNMRRRIFLSKKKKAAASFSENAPEYSSGSDRIRVIRVDSEADIEEVL